MGSALERHPTRGCYRDGVHRAGPEARRALQADDGSAFPQVLVRVLRLGGRPGPPRAGGQPDQENQAQTSRSLRDLHSPDRTLHPVREDQVHFPTESRKLDPAAAGE